MKENELGSKIRELRTKEGLTQKDLAEKLFVTPQAISRWENDGIEPPIDSLKKMASLFHISLDDLLSVKQEEEKEAIEETPVEEEKEETPPVPVFYGVCDECHNPFRGSDDIHERVLTKRIRHGKHHETVTTTVKICSSCEAKQVEEEKRKEELEQEKNSGKAHERRLRAVWLSPLCAAALAGLVALFILMFCNQLPAYKENPASFYIVPLIIVFLLSIPMFACVFLNNNVVTSIVGEILLHFTFKAPGVIISADWGGVAFLIVIKIIFAIIAFLVGLLGFFVACAIGSIVAIFVIGPSVKKSYDHPEEHIL